MTFLKATVVVLVLMAGFAAVPGASAQLPGGGITLLPGAFMPSATVPDGDPAVANVTVDYTCAGFSGDITLTATVIEGNGTATPTPSTITPASLPDCTPGEDVRTYIDLSVTADASNLAGDLIVVNLTASAQDVFQQEVTHSVDVGPAVGPFIDVTFALQVSSFEVVAGEQANATLVITSSSNDDVMAMPSIDDRPDLWSIGGLVPREVAPPSDPGSGSSEATVPFTIEVPEDTASGVYHMNLTVFAHAMLNESLTTETRQLPITVTVTGGGGGPGGETGDSPAAGFVPLALAALAVVGLLRHRRR